MNEKYVPIRVVIPAYNSIRTIQPCVHAIEAATSLIPLCEIVVVDNGKNSGIKEYLKNSSVKLLERKELCSAAYARNEGAKDFTNGILVFIDSDVICEKDCIESLIKPIINKQSQASIGNYSKKLNGLSFTQKYKQLYINHVYSRDGDLIQNDFWTAISAIDAGIFHQLQGFDTRFIGANGEDQELGIRLTSRGYKVVSARTAQGQHLNPYGIGNVIKNDFKKGITAVGNSLQNNIPFSDNRHANKSGILAVFFSALALCFLVLMTITIPIGWASCVAFLFWYVCRFTIGLTFLRNGGVFFYLPALLLMFCLDLVRFACVITGYIRNHYPKFTPVFTGNHLHNPIKE
jgi:glycosyltransferase involved in cell wall biosynthesis